MIARRGLSVVREPMIIGSFKLAREFAEFDPETGSLSCFQRERAELEARQAQMQGRYAHLEDSTLVFYRKDELLHLRIAVSDYCLDDEIESHLEKHWVGELIQASPLQLRTAVSRLAGGYRTFSLTRNGMVLVSLKYRTPIESVSPFDFTPFEDEDFDFLLFVHNVLSDPERRHDIWADR